MRRRGAGEPVDRDRQLGRPELTGVGDVPRWGQPSFPFTSHLGMWAHGGAGVMPVQLAASRYPGDQDQGQFPPPRGRSVGHRIAYRPC